MPDLSDEDIRTITVQCANCGEPIELASSAFSLFESEDKVMCVECMVRATDAAAARTFSLEDRVALIDDVVQDFSSRLRNILMRSVRPDLSWNNDYGFDEWSDPADSAVAAHAPGIWYSGREAALSRRRSSM